MLKLLKAQLNVLEALTVREIQAMQANLAFGYGWVIFDALLSFCGLLIMKLAIHSFDRPGIPTITFLVSGLVPWLMFNSCYTTPNRVSRNTKLLALPRVTPLDLILSSCLQIFCTYGLLFVALATISSFYEKVPFPRFPLGIILLFISCSLMGVALGLVLMILSRLYAPAGKFVGFFMRFGMILSGVFISITVFPPFIWPYLTWNPMLHVMELLRVYWFYNYVSPIARPAYILECLIVLAFVGLLVERYVRRRLPI